MQIRAFCEVTVLEMRAMVRDVLSWNISEKARANVRMIVKNVLEYAGQLGLISYSAREVIPDMLPPVRTNIGPNKSRSPRKPGKLDRKHSPLHIVR